MKKLVLLSILCVVLFTSCAPNKQTTVVVTHLDNTVDTIKVEFYDALKICDANLQDDNGYIVTYGVKSFTSITPSTKIRP